MNKADVIKSEVNEVTKAEVAITVGDINDDIIDKVTDIEGITISEEEEKAMIEMIDDIELHGNLSMSKEEIASAIQSQAVPTLNKL